MWFTINSESKPLVFKTFTQCFDERGVLTAKHGCSPSLYTIHSEDSFLL